MSIYINFDLETTGPHPDRNAILQIGAVAHDSESWNELGNYTSNLKIANNRGWDPDTKHWWENDPEAGKEKLELVMSHAQHPANVTIDFFHWLRSLRSHLHLTTKDNRIVFVANPISYDLPFLKSYMLDFVGDDWVKWAAESKCGIGGIDLPTLAMTVMGADIRDDIPAWPDARRRMWPERWSPKDKPHTHIAIDDARHQAHAFECMMRELQEVRNRRPY